MDFLFTFDFSSVDLSTLANDCISSVEVESIFYDGKAKYIDNLRHENLGFFIGYSPMKKFVSFYFQMQEDTIHPIEVYLSDETEIEFIYFQR